MKTKTLVSSILCFASISFTALAEFSPCSNKLIDFPVGEDPFFKQSLEELEKTVPLTYNEVVKKNLRIFTTSQKDRERFARVLARSKYYFPIYEKIFKEKNVPDEIKYLSVVESSLNPHALSHAGAAGPWQFIWQIGKIYGLTINDSIDERKDPVLACKAAANYLLDSYHMYGDWLVAIASYNCGRNNIKWAMEKAGGGKDYWTLRQYLPIETQNYVPAYIATVYMMNNYRKHGIRPGEADFNTNTDTITTIKTVTLKEIARQGNFSLADLTVLNASYLHQTVYASVSAPKTLVIPASVVPSYNSVARLVGAPERKIPESFSVSAGSFAVAVQRRAKSYITYRVQPGDSLASISEKFKDLTIEEIVSANRLADNSVLPGKLLKINQY